MPPNFTLAVFAKAPVPGQVKTRLLRDAEQSARLYAAFVQDTLQTAARLGPPVTVYHAGDRAGLESLVPPGVRWTDQGGGSLGERLARVPAPCLILGTDSPHLPVSILRASLSALSHADLVLGPAEDGGYYLIGLQASQPALFQGIAWSTERVLAQTLARADVLALKVLQTPLWYDLDRPSDLLRLKQKLENLSLGSDDDCPATRKVLEEITLVE